MKMKKILASALAAVMLLTVAPAYVPAATVNAAATSATAAQATTETAVQKPTKLKVTAKSKAIKVTFKKSSTKSVKGYEIQYSTSKNFTKKTTKTVKTTKTSYTIKKLKAKKKYYVRVRTYTKKDKSNWTSSKSVKTKK